MWQANFSKRATALWGMVEAFLRTFSVGQAYLSPALDIIPSHNHLTATFRTCRHLLVMITVLNQHFENAGSNRATKLWEERSVSWNDTFHHDKTEKLNEYKCVILSKVDWIITLFKAPGSTANSPWRKRQRRQLPAFQQLLILDPVPSCGSHAGWLAAAPHDGNEICDNLMMIISCFIQTSETRSRLTSSWLVATAHFHTGLLLNTHLNTLLSLLKTFKLYNTNSLKMSTRVFLTCLSRFQLLSTREHKVIAQKIQDLQSNTFLHFHKRFVA